MRRKLVFALAALIVVCGGGLVGLEITARALRPELTREAILARIEHERENRRRPDPWFHHVADGIFALHFPAAGAAAEPRMMIVGDSFAMGHGVGEAARFGTLLEAHLHGRISVDVLAASSYSPIIYRNIVRRALSAAPYAGVAVFLDQTDPSDEIVYETDLRDGEASREFDLERMRDREAVVARTYQRMVDRLSGWRGLPRRSVLVNLVFPGPFSLFGAFPEDSPHYRYVQLSKVRGQMVHLFADEPGDPVTRRMEALLLAHLDEIVELCAARGIPLILAANPWEYQVSAHPRVGSPFAPPYPRENRLERLLVERYGGRPGIEVLPLTEAFREQPDPSALFLDDPSYEIHWNRQGHRVVERALREPVQRLVLDAPRPAALAVRGQARSAASPPG